MHPSATFLPTIPDALSQGRSQDQQQQQHLGLGRNGTKTLGAHRRPSFCLARAQVGPSGLCYAKPPADLDTSRTTTPLQLCLPGLAPPGGDKNRPRWSSEDLSAQPALNKALGCQGRPSQGDKAACRAPVRCGFDTRLII